jgi:hypothetical protein
MAATRYGVMQLETLLQLANPLQQQLGCTAVQLLADGAAAILVALAPFSSSNST